MRRIEYIDSFTGQIYEANYDQTTRNRNTPATGNVIMADIRAIVVLTGAGISAESGLRTFRDNNGLWENERIEDVATPEAFRRDPGARATLL